MSDRKIRIPASFTIEPDQREQADEVAGRPGWSFAELTRRAVAEFLAREQQQPA